MSHDPLIQIVDENDKPVGSASIDEAQIKGLVHRIARVMAFDENSNVLLQKRPADKFIYPNTWDPTSAGHVDVGEDYETAAARELEEEMGIKTILKEAAYYRTDKPYKGRRLNRFNKLYTAQIPRETKVKIQEAEVAGARWFSRAEIDELMKNNPEQASDGLKETYNKLLDENYKY